MIFPILYAAGRLLLAKFTGADNNSSIRVADTGQPWIPLRGVWGIKNNQAYPVSGQAFKHIAAVTRTKSDCAVSVTFSTITNESKLVLRAQDADNFLTLRATPSSYAFRRYVAASSTEIGAYTTTPQSGDRVKVAMQGDKVTVFINGVQRFSVTESTFQTSNQHGIGSYNDAPTDMFDDFEVVDIP